MAGKKRAVNPRRTKRKCGTCRYRMNGDECWRFPPQVYAWVTMDGTGSVSSTRPVVGRCTDACGEWEPNNAAQTPDSPSDSPE